MPSGACSPLVARNKEFPNTAECAWLIINGVVVGDFYDDENRRDVLDKRLDEQARQLRKTVDRELVELIDYGMPASSGM
jgi:lysyl-tRNA synthetase class II